MYQGVPHIIGDHPVEYILVLAKDQHAKFLLIAAIPGICVLHPPHRQSQPVNANLLSSFFLDKALSALFSGPGLYTILKWYQSI